MERQLNTLVGRLSLSANRGKVSGAAADGTVVSNGPVRALEFKSAELELSAKLRTLDALWHHDALRSLLLLGLAPQLSSLRTPRDLSALAEQLETDPVQALCSLRGGWMLFLVNHHRQEGLLATSRAGIRSPCFAALPDRILFGMSALDVARADPRLGALNSQALFDYLHWHFIPAPDTIFAGVERLRPGEFLHFGTKPPTRSYYWQASYGGSSRIFDFGANRDTFRKLLENGVRTETSAGRTGAFLSGGTDSSTIAGVLGHIAGAPIHTYSIGFDVDGFDEMAYARIAATHFGTIHHEHYLTPAEVLAAIPRVAVSYDQPFGNSSALPAFHCATLAQQDGMQRLLGGDGGDEIFGGNTRYAKQKIFELYWRAPSMLRTASESALLATSWTARAPLIRKARSYVEQARVPIPARLHTYNLITRIGAENIFEPAFLRSIDTQAAAQQEVAWYEQCTADDFVNRMLHLDWKYTLADNDLPKVVGTCDLAGIGVGFPMLNEDLVDFANNLPATQKVKGLQLRPFFKTALADFLPAAIIAKKKHGFGLPFGPWLVKHDYLHALASGALNTLASRGIVRPSFIRELLNERIREHAVYYGELVFVMLMLEQWLEAYQPSYRFESG
jgi:asparagine synthase (glutamine-hydrolysing)